jgi:hypothetical protein
MRQRVEARGDKLCGRPIERVDQVDVERLLEDAPGAAERSELAAWCGNSTQVPELESRTRAPLLDPRRPPRQHRHARGDLGYHFRRVAFGERVAGRDRDKATLADGVS